MTPIGVTGGVIEGFIKEYVFALLSLPIKSLLVILSSLEIDKLSEKQRRDNLSHFQSHLLEQGWESIPPMFESSAKTGEGKEEIINYITSINSNL